MTNNKISKKGTFGTTMGVTSIIAILVILVLIVFAALSITTAKADLTLSEKTAESTTAFYKADTKAEEMFAEVAAAGNGGPLPFVQTSGVLPWSAKLGSEYTVSIDNGDTIVEYVVPISDSEALSVKLRVTPGGKITRELWRVHSTTEWEGDDNLQLIIE